MANITFPIQVNLPDDWIEQIIERLKNDPEGEWAPIIHCRDCKKYETKLCAMDIWTDQVTILSAKPDDFCSRAERREE